MHLYEVSMARNYFDFGLVSYDVGSGDAFHDHTAWHTHQTRATLQHCVFTSVIVPKIVASTLQEGQSTL